MLFTGRQTRWDILTWHILTWDVLTLGHFDSGRFWLGMFWLWDVLTRDVLTLGRFDLGHFDFGTLWLGTIWLWDILTSVFTKNVCYLEWLNIVKIYLGHFDTKNGTFWQITRDVLVLGRFDPIPLEEWLVIYLMTHRKCINFQHKGCIKMKAPIKATGGKSSIRRLIKTGSLSGPNKFIRSIKDLIYYNNNIIYNNSIVRSLGVSDLFHKKPLCIIVGDTLIIHRFSVGLKLRLTLLDLSCDLDTTPFCLTPRDEHTSHQFNLECKFRLAFHSSFTSQSEQSPIYPPLNLNTWEGQRLCLAIVPRRQC